MLVSRALHTLWGTADTAWVGRLGPEAIAAVSTSFFASWMLFAVGDVFVAGCMALVSRAVGAGRDGDAARAAATGFALAVIAGGLVATGGWFGAPALFRFLYDDPRIVAMGSDYLSIFCLLAPALYIALVAETIWRACGDSRTPMLVVATGTILNVVLDPFLILGIGPFPAWGVRGAAIATVLSEIVVILLFGLLAIRGRWPLARPRVSRDLLDPGRVGRIVRIGLPHAAIGVLYSIVYLFLARVAGGFGAPALAALGIVNRVESINYLTATAMGMGVATLVGQNLGAGRPDRAERAAHLGGLFVTITTGAVTIAFLLLAEPIVRLFTSDPATVAEGAWFLRIVAISQVFMGWEISYDHAFTGAGDTLPPMIVSVGVSVLRLPLAWGLAVPLGLGPDGVWWTISLTGILRGIVVPAWFLRGRWKTKDVGVETAEPLLRAAALPGPDSPEG